MSRARALALLVLCCGLAIGALSFVPEWLVHNRTLYGEGYRHLVVGLSAWESRAVPVTSLGVCLAIVAGLLAAARLLREGMPAWPMQTAASAGLATLLASAVPIGHHAFASAVDLSAGWPLLAATVLAAVAAVASLVTERPTRTRLAVAVAMLVAATPALAVGRYVLLGEAEGTNQHYADGTYTHVVDGAKGETLTLRNGTYAIGDAWSGRVDEAELVLSFIDDPACPEARGTYFVWAVGTGGDVRFEEVVDTCADGARSAELMAGTWTRNR